MPEEVESNPGRVTAAVVARRKRAIELRSLGKTYQEIADELGYASDSGAYQAIRKGMVDTLREPAEELRTLEMQRYDKLQANLWPEAMNPENTLDERMKATDRILKIMSQRAKTMGLEYDERKFIRWEDVRTLLQLVAQNVLVRYVKAEDVTQAKQELRRITRQADPKGA